MSNAIRWLRQGERLTGACRDGNAAAGAPWGGLPLRALVVDDLPVHRLLLFGMLKVLFPTMSVDEAGDGEQAQEMLRAQRYDIVLSDWMMPGMDGLCLANWLRSGELPPSPFVLFSARDSEEEIAPLFETHGIGGYLIKPFDQAAIKEVVTVTAGILVPAA